MGGRAIAKFAITNGAMDIAMVSATFAVVRVSWAMATPPAGHAGMESARRKCAVLMRWRATPVSF